MRVGRALRSAADGPTHRELIFRSALLVGPAHRGADPSNSEMKDPAKTTGSKIDLLGRHFVVGEVLIIMC